MSNIAWVSSTEQKAIDGLNANNVMEVYEAFMQANDQVSALVRELRELRNYVQHLEGEIADLIA